MADPKQEPSILDDIEALEAEAEQLLADEAAAELGAKKLHSLTASSAVFHPYWYSVACPEVRVKSSPTEEVRKGLCKGEASSSVSTKGSVVFSLGASLSV